MLKRDWIAAAHKWLQQADCGWPDLIFLYFGLFAFLHFSILIFLIFVFCILYTETVHYRLRPIEGVQFRFDNFGSHFICVQIFQIDFSTLLLILSAYKYFRLILRRPNEHFSISVWNFHAKETFVKQFRKEKGTSWTLLNDSYIWSKQVAQRFFQKNIHFWTDGRPSGPLHGEIGLLQKQILFCKHLCATCLLQI